MASRWLFILQLNTCSHRILEREYNSWNVYRNSRQFINHCHRLIENRLLTLTRLILWMLYVFVWKEFVLTRHTCFSLRFGSQSDMNCNNVSTAGLVWVGRIAGWMVLNSISRLGEHWITRLYLCSENLMRVCLMILVFFLQTETKTFFIVCMSVGPMSITNCINWF